MSPQHTQRRPVSVPRLRGLDLADGHDTDPFNGYAGYLLALGLSPRTVRIYERLLERFFVHAADDGFDPLEANVFDLSGYAQTLPNTSTSKRQHRVALRHWYEWQGRVDAPLEAIRVPPKKRGVSRALEPGQAVDLAKTASGWWPHGAAVLLGLYLGLRREEIALTRWDRFDYQFEWYTVIGKGDVEAVIPVHPVLEDELRPHMGAFPWVFPGRASAHVSPGTIGSWVGIVGEEAGIPKLTPHQLRHTAIATVNDVSGDLRMAQEFARHADVETTMIYTRVGLDRLKRAIDTLNYLDDVPAPGPTHHKEDGST